MGLRCGADLLRHLLLVFAIAVTVAWRYLFGLHHLGSVTQIFSLNIRCYSTVLRIVLYYAFVTFHLQPNTYNLLDT